jgi:hypothetical protein
MSENSPSNAAAADQPLTHFTSAAAVVSAELGACRAPLTMKAVPGRAWNTGVMLRSVLKSCAQARRPRSVTIAVYIAKDLSSRTPSSVRDAVTSLAA